MKTKIDIKIITPETPMEEIIELSLLSGPSNKEHYKKIMEVFILNSLSQSPDLNIGIVYGLYKGKELIASARIKQDDYTYSAVSIEYVAVKPGYRKQGFGKLFLQSLFEEIKKDGRKKL